MATQDLISLNENESLRFSFINPENCQAVWMSGDEYRILVDAKKSNSNMTLIHAYVPPTGGPPSHFHSDEDELFFVLEGHLNIMADGVTKEVGPGECVYVARKTPHAFYNKGTSAAKMLIFYTPAGVEEFFLAAGKPAIAGHEPPSVNQLDTAREVEIASHHNITNAQHIERG